MKRPHRFSIEIDSAFSPGIQYLFQNGNFEVHYRGQIQRLATPTKMQWSGFWRLCEFIDLWNWLPEYGKYQARDGESWELDIAFDKSKHIHSSGMNNYPSLESAQRCSSTQDRFSLLLTFIDMALLDSRYDQRNDFAEYPELDQ